MKCHTIRRKLKKKGREKGQKRYLHLLSRERQMEKKIEPQIYLKKKWEHTTEKETEKFFLLKIRILNCKSADNSRLRRALNLPLLFQKQVFKIGIKKPHKNEDFILCDSQTNSDDNLTYKLLTCTSLILTYKCT